MPRALRLSCGKRRYCLIVAARAEIEIVRMIAQGLRNRVIAERLSISEGTVKVHLHNICENLGVNGRLELVLHTQSKGLV